MARGSWRSRWAAPGQDPQLDLALGGVGEGPGVEHRHHLVVGPVHQQDRSGRDLADQAQRPDLPQLPGPGVEVGRKAGIPDDSRRPGLGHEAAGVHGPLGEVGRGREGGHAPDPGVLPGRAQRQRPAGREPAQPHGVHAAGRPDSTSVAALRSASQPPSEKLPDDWDVPRKLKVSTTQPVSAASRSASSLVAAVRVPGLGRVHRKAVAEDQPVAAGTARRRRGGPGQVGGQRHVSGAIGTPRRIENGPAGLRVPGLSGSRRSWLTGSTLAHSSRAGPPCRRPRYEVLHWNSGLSVWMSGGTMLPTGASRVTGVD